MTEIKTVVILGAGNVAWHIGHKLAETGIKIRQVFNRTTSNGKDLADSLDVVFTVDIEKIDQNSDLYIITVSDDAIATVTGSLGFINEGLLVHTAGSVPMDILAPAARNFGVLYPFQTFTKGREVDFKKIPLLVEANNPGNLSLLTDLAGKMSDRVYQADSEKRAILHLAAVLSSNFSNHLMMLAEKLLVQHSLHFDMLHPLIVETMSKAFEIGPEKAQTGPAVRGNTKVIQKHLDMLKEEPEVRKIYEVISRSILKGGEG